MRLIDADRLKAEIMGWCVVTDDLFGMGRYHEREIVLQAIEESPTIDPTKRGKWERIENAHGELEGFACECDIGLDGVGDPICGHSGIFRMEPLGEAGRCACGAL